ARAFVNGKIANCRYLLNRALRDHPEKLDCEAVNSAADHLTGLLKSLGRDMPLEKIRGTEGDGAHVYFSVFDHLIIRNKEDFFFQKRSRRPPLDLVNCLLSFLYTLIMHDVRSALECTGLDPAVGFLHRDRPGRSGLALDMMEEFRPVADRTALSLINRGQLQAKDFVVSDSGGVRMKDKARKILLSAYQERKQDVLQHPFLEEKMPLGLFFHTQALLLARFLRGDLDGYPPIIQR
ncbi:MAG: CRISPR-associated endonuclease Cas1, partial [Candidatus Electrothrix sp. EH2]|nr:CRISPR-associated endonuclease Cas1 [Candidatus Electrothrix sp. EH2]